MQSAVRNLSSGCYASAAAAASHADRWEMALHLVCQDMPERDIHFDIACCNVAIGSCEAKAADTKVWRAIAWEVALRMLNEISMRSVMPNGSSYSAVASACKVSGQHNLAVALLDEALQLLIAPCSLEHYNAALSLSEDSGDWQRALALLVEAHECLLMPDGASYGAAVGACEKCL
eukprot:gnl/MRDRNA2_/MRDRNA2_54695_c0_seq2.p1 gnl/MRDRNA2_/MRDRNA2_54695_c0~~gnl/MRDRNA2_/MRDRNA2_54695_c0_seq2.p1  ORF type:complete len:176 (-),score=34.49 gnl/MRDRNA2_/MRDRNA2_54695_c0_seq2:18-545(-)